MMKIGRFRFARRRIFLGLFGVVYILIGSSLVGVPMTPAIRHIFRFALGIMPFAGYATMWITCGCVAIVDAVVPRGHKTVGFVAATVAPIAWSLVYFAAWLDLDSVARGVTQVWETALVFALIAAAVTVVAGMSDPLETQRRLRMLGETVHRE